MIAAYMRYSPTAKTDGASIEVQSDAILAWKRDSHNANEFRAYADRGVSGKNTDRPRLRKMLEEIKRGDTVVVHSLSRLARSTIDACTIAEELRAKGVGLVILDLAIDTSTPMGACFFQIVASFAELERKLIGERTSKAMIRHQANGRYIGGHPPYGYMKIGKELEECPEEQVWLKKMRRWSNEGHTAGWIAARLAKLEAVCRGGEWHRQTVQRALRRDVCSR